MKTPDEWSASHPNLLVGNHKQILEVVKSIQLDAWRQGMTDAAEITSLWLFRNQLHPDIPNDKLNESAKVAAHSVLQQATTSILAARDAKGETK